MKKFILRLLPWLITAALLAVLTVFVIIPLFAPEEVVNVDQPIIYYYEGDDKPLTMENDYLSFELDSTTTHFKVVDKASGREWLSNPADADKDKIAVATNKETLQATAVVTYCTSAGVVDLNNYKYSIEGGNYQVLQQEDGSIRVDYAIGKIEKIYCIPTAITPERFNAFCENMKKATQKKLKSNYNLYEPEKLDSKKNKDEIIALYPSVVDQALYILKSDTSESNKKKIEGYFEEGGYNQDEYLIDQANVAGSKDNSGAVFNVSLVYRLEGNDLVVDVPYEDIRYKSDYTITYVTPLPMFGAAGTADEGSIFIPEGGGALINFNNGKLQQNPYYANVYGWDYGTFRKELVSETRVSYPVFGMIKNGSSFLCLMEGATSFGGVQADISGRYTTYNTVSAKYNVLHADQYNVSNKTAQLVYMFEKELPDVTVTHRYRFFETDSYVELANAYGQYLRQTYPELAEATSSEEMPVSVELVGAIDKTVVKFGLPIDSTFATTTFAEATEIMNDLLSKGISNLNVRFSGWANGGVNQEVFTRVRILRELGGKSAMQKLIASAQEAGVPLYFDGINCFAFDSGILEGFIPFSHAARYTTREQVYQEGFDIITYQTADWLQDYYLLKPEYIQANTTNMLNALKEMNAYGVAFRDIGNLLSADYNPKNTTTREEVKALNIESMKEAHAAGQKVIIKTGNDYAVPYADLITDMDLTGTPYSLIDQSIPFYQIALHGIKDYTGEPLNLNGDFIQDFLRCVEYGSGLNFTFFAADGKVLQDTYHTNYYSANYDLWADEVGTLVTKYQKDMAGLNQQDIVLHEKLNEFVNVTGYADGTKVYVNYADDAQTVQGVTIEARSYTVERGQ